MTWGNYFKLAAELQNKQQRIISFHTGVQTTRWCFENEAVQHAELWSQNNICWFIGCLPQDFYQYCWSLHSIAAGSDQRVVTRRIKQVVERDQRANLKNSEYLQKSSAVSPNKTDSWLFWFWKPLEVNIHVALSTRFWSQCGAEPRIPYSTKFVLQIIFTSFTLPSSSPDSFPQDQSHSGSLPWGVNISFLRCRNHS